MLTTATVWGVTFVQWGWWMVATLAQSFDWRGGGRGWWGWEGRRNRVGEERGGEKGERHPLYPPFEYPTLWWHLFLSGEKGREIREKGGRGKNCSRQGRKGGGRVPGRKGGGRKRGRRREKRGRERREKDTPCTPFERHLFWKSPSLWVHLFSSVSDSVICICDHSYIWIVSYLVLSADSF